MLKVGWHQNIPMEQYHGDRDTFSKSSVCDFAEKGARRFKYDRDNGINKKASKIMEIGTATHALILEGEDVFNRVVADPEPEYTAGEKRGKQYLSWKRAVYDEWEKESFGKIKFSRDEIDTVKRMRDFALSNRTAEDLLTKGIPEHTGVFNHYHGLTMKFRPDNYKADCDTIVDLKITTVFREYERHSYYNLKNHWSAAISSLGAYSLTGKMHDYIFVIIDAIPPHDMMIKRTPQWLVDAGIIESGAVIEDIVECINSGVWPGYESGITELSAPESIKRLYHHDI